MAKKSTSSPNNQPHLMPIDTSRGWIMSLERGVWHLTTDGCHYIYVIKPHNREYTDLLSKDCKLCTHCQKAFMALVAEGMKFKVDIPTTTPLE